MSETRVPHEIGLFAAHLLLREEANRLLRLVTVQDPVECCNVVGVPPVLSLRREIAGCIEEIGKLAPLLVTLAQKEIDAHRDFKQKLDRSVPRFQP